MGGLKEGLSSTSLFRARKWRDLSSDLGQSIVPYDHYAFLRASVPPLSSRSGASIRSSDHPALRGGLPFRLVFPTEFRVSQAIVDQDPACSATQVDSD